MKNWIDNIKWTQDGLVPVVVQDYISNKVIMFAWMNRLSLEASIKEKKAIYWSRSRKKIWTKGESSGHYQYIKDMIIDCDKDVLLIKSETRRWHKLSYGKGKLFLLSSRYGK